MIAYIKMNETCHYVFVSNRIINRIIAPYSNKNAFISHFEETNNSKPKKNEINKAIQLFFR